MQAAYRQQPLDAIGLELVCAGAAIVNIEMKTPPP